MQRTRQAEVRQYLSMEKELVTESHPYPKSYLELLADGRERGSFL